MGAEDNEVGRGKPEAEGDTGAAEDDSSSAVTAIDPRPHARRSRNERHAVFEGIVVDVRKEDATKLMRAGSTPARHRH